MKPDIKAVQEDENTSDSHIIDLIQQKKTDNLIKLLKKNPEILNRRMTYNGLLEYTSYPSHLTSKHNAENNFTILHWIVSEENLEMLKTLVENFRNKLDMNIKASRVITDAYLTVTADRFAVDITPLHLAVMMNAKTDITDYLIKNGASTCLTDHNHSTPLLTALNAKKYEHATCLVESNHDLGINCVRHPTREDTANIKSLAITAISDCSNDLAKKLLSISNLDVNKRDANGRTALYYINESNNADKLKLFLSHPHANITLSADKEDTTLRHGSPLIKLADKSGHALLQSMSGLFSLANDCLIYYQASKTNNNPDYSSSPRAPIKFKYLNLSNGDMNDILDALQKNIQGKVSDVQLLKSALVDIKQQIVHQKNTLFTSHPDAKDFSNEKLLMLNSLFVIAHHHNIKPDDQQILNAIRQVAWRQFSASIANLDPAEKLKKLETAKTLPVFTLHRHVYDLGKTDTAKKIDMMISALVNPTLSKQIA